MVLCRRINSDPYKMGCYVVIAPTCVEADHYIDNEFDHILEDKLVIVGDDNNKRGYQVKCKYIDGKYIKSNFFIIIDAESLEDTTLEHECIHLTWDLLEYCGVVITHDNHEAFTFLYEHLLEQCRVAVKEYQDKQPEPTQKGNKK